MTLPLIKALPYGYDESDLVDITTVGCLFKRYANKRTGVIIDCEDVYNKHVECLERGAIYEITIRREW